MARGVYENSKVMKMKILLCEDDYGMRNLLFEKLKSEGFSVQKAEDGREAYKLLKKKKYNLIITDLLMPFRTGLELIDFIRNERKMNIPIIVFSKVQMEGTVLTAFAMGADDYMVKPFSPNELSL
ncbi:MAG: response regulator transcription factor, partial [Bacteroidales bacterium]|nr:response regulator transcription factor [Bacteroidales bacterium]